MNNPLVSVIIPIYNVEKHVKNGVNQVLNQSYKNIEVLLVNDGSTDSSARLLDEIAINDNRIKVFHTTNMGSGPARNVGLDNATGDYVWFFDVDDNISEKLIERSLALIIKSNAELLVFGFTTYDVLYKTSSKVQFEDLLLESNSDLRNCFVDKLFMVPNGNGFVWNKFYLREFIERNKFRFGDQLIQQDELFNIQLYPKVNKLLISSEVLYHYFIYNSGNTRSRYIANRFDIVTTVHQRLLSFARDWGVDSPEYLQKIQLRYWGGINSEIRFNIFHPDANLSCSEKRARIYRVLNNENVKETLSSITSLNCLSSEDKLFIKAYKSVSPRMIIVLNQIVNILKPLAIKLFRR